MKTPKYLTEPLDANPKIGRPIKAMVQLSQRIGARVLYLSPIQAVPYIRNTARMYGGGPRHWLAATLKPRFTFNMMGRKNANE